jgi:hypothetical protein
MRVTQKPFTAEYVEMEIYIMIQRREEDNIYEDHNEAIYHVSSKPHEYCIISIDHTISFSELKFSKLF